MARISTLHINEFLKSFSISLNSSVIGDNRTRWYGVVDGMWDQCLGLSVPLAIVFPSSIGDNLARWYGIVDGIWGQLLGLSVPLVFPSCIDDNRSYDLVGGIWDLWLGVSVPLVFPSCWLWAGSAFWDLVEKGTSRCIITFISVPMVHVLIITLHNNRVQGEH